MISDEDFACNREDVRVVGRDGDVVLKRGQTSAPIAIRDLKIIWYCEEAGRSDMQDWAAPGGTEYIVVTRGVSGGHGKVSYYKS
jgi:hypothetical protein